MEEQIEQLFKKLSFIYIAITISALTFSGICLFAYKNNMIDFGIQNNNIYFIKTFMYFIILGGIPAGYFIKKQLTKQTSLEANYTKKLDIYFKISIIKFALHEVLVLIASAACLITVHKHLLIMWAISVILLLMNKPNKSKLKEELQLNQNQL